MAFQEAPPAEPLPPPIVEIGSSGLRRSGGMVLEEYLPELSGRRGLEVYRRMQSDPVVGGLLFAIESLIRQVEWKVTAVDESQAAADAQEFAESLMCDMSHSWADMMSEIASMLPYGFAPMEIVLKQRRGPDQTDPAYRSEHDDGRYGVRKLSLRAQYTIDRWVFSDAGDALGFWQDRYELGLPQVYVPLERCLLFRTKAISGNPQGHSILRSAYKAWYLRGKLEQIEAIGIERDLAGLPVYKVPAKIMSEDDPKSAKAYRDAMDLVTRVRRDQQEGLLLPSDRDEKGNPYYEFTLLSSGGTRALDVDKAISRYNAQILMSCLADFMMLGSGSSGGSWALSADKTEMFTVALRVFLGSIADTLNRGLLPVVWSINGMDRSLMPKFVPGDIEPPDLGKLGSFVTSLTSAGAPLFPDERLEDALRAKAGLPPIPDDREQQHAEAAATAADQAAQMMADQQQPADQTAGDQVAKHLDAIIAGMVGAR